MLLSSTVCGSSRFLHPGVSSEPTDGIEHREAHLDAELYPAYRMPGRLRYLAGSEISGGVFTADTLPEQKVEELRAVVVDLRA